MSDAIKQEMARIRAMATEITSAMDEAMARAIEAETEVGLLREQVRGLKDELAARAPGRVMRAPFRVRFLDDLGNVQTSAPFTEIEEAIKIAEGEAVARDHVHVVGADNASLMTFGKARSALATLHKIIRELQAQLAAAQKGRAA